MKQTEFVNNVFASVQAAIHLLILGSQKQTRKAHPDRHLFKHIADRVPGASACLVGFNFIAVKVLKMVL